MTVAVLYQAKSILVVICSFGIGLCRVKIVGRRFEDRWIATRFVRRTNGFGVDIYAEELYY